MAQPSKRKSDNRWEQFNCLIDTGLVGLTPSERITLLVAFRYGRGMGFFRCPVSEVVKKTGLTKTTVRGAFKGLVKKGIIKLQKANKGRRTREYRIQFEKSGTGVVLRKANTDSP